jgi:hypothetical protein
MRGTRNRRVAGTALLATGLTIGLTSTSTAAPPQPVDAYTADFPAGLACDFPLRVSASSGRIVVKKFVDTSGHVVRVLQVGTGVAYTYTNLSTSKSVTTAAGGSAMRTVIQDGVETVTASGHNALILFPTDVPEGPSTTVYHGRVVYTIDLASGVFTLLSTSGSSVDMCAALA